MLKKAAICVVACLATAGTAHANMNDVGHETAGACPEHGTVGPIGGIRQKLVGAHDGGATWFLAPAANCDEAKANAVKGLPMVRVATIDDALAALQALREKRTPPLC